MSRLVLDTQFYIEFLRASAAGAETRDFLAARRNDIDFHALVGAELLVGALSAAEAVAIQQRVIDRFTPARLIGLDVSDMLAAGEALRLLRQRFGPHPEHDQRSFWNDVLIAVSCRRRGAVLISRDHDHARIAEVVKHTVVTTLGGAR